MLKITCDMCGKEIKKIDTAGALSFRPSAFAPAEQRGPIVQMELCRSCGKALIETLADLKEETESNEKEVREER